MFPYTSHEVLQRDFPQGRPIVWLVDELRDLHRVGVPSPNLPLPGVLPEEDAWAPPLEVVDVKGSLKRGNEGLRHERDLPVEYLGVVTRPKPVQFAVHHHEGLCRVRLVQLLHGQHLVHTEGWVRAEEGPVLRAHRLGDVALKEVQTNIPQERRRCKVPRADLLAPVPRTVQVHQTSHLALLRQHDSKLSRGRQERCREVRGVFQIRVHLHTPLGVPTHRLQRRRRELHLLQQYSVFQRHGYGAARLA
mmetsp:Transcript_703/g.2180  ORF Transcript_703/g.2180 Transcript_703/m.2180 type:complete len:248 (+) Transcript_703:40-783(+)